VEELTCFEELNINTADPMALWAGQTLLPDHPVPGGRAWANPQAVAVYAPALNRFNRLVVSGDVERVAELLDEVPAHCPPDTRLLTTTELADQLDRSIRGFHRSVDFGWMRHRSGSASRREIRSNRFTPRWLRDDEADLVNELLDRANPDSWARPGETPTTRWVGGFDRDGRLVSVGTTAPESRDQGAGAVVCAFLRDQLSAYCPWVALMTMPGDRVARVLYHKLGFSHHGVTGWAPANR
jgi:hypothetical protein